MQDADDAPIRPRGPKSEQSRDSGGLDPRPDRVKCPGERARSQGENRAVALKRLRIELALSVRRPIDLGGARAYAPSPLWLRRCRGGRIVVSPDHDDFPAVLAEALDVLHAGSFDPRIAGLALGCSPSQLIKLLKEEPRAMRLINEATGERGPAAPLVEEGTPAPFSRKREARRWDETCLRPRGWLRGRSIPRRSDLRRPDLAVPIPPEVASRFRAAQENRSSRRARPARLGRVRLAPGLDD